MNILKKLSPALALIAVSFCLTVTAAPIIGAKKIYILKNDLNNPAALYVRGAFVYFDKDNGSEIVGKAFSVIPELWEPLRQTYLANISIDAVDWEHFPMDAFYMIIRSHPAFLPEMLPHLFTRASRETIAENLPGLLETSSTADPI